MMKRSELPVPGSLSVPKSFPQYTTFDNGDCAIAHHNLTSKMSKMEEQTMAPVQATNSIQEAPSRTVGKLIKLPCEQELCLTFEPLIMHFCMDRFQRSVKTCRDRIRAKEIVAILPDLQVQNVIGNDVPK